MEHPGFHERAGPFSLRAIAKATGAKLAEGADSFTYTLYKPKQGFNKFVAYM